MRGEGHNAGEPLVNLRTWEYHNGEKGLYRHDIKSMWHALPVVSILTLLGV